MTETQPTQPPETCCKCGNELEGAGANTNVAQRVWFLQSWKYCTNNIIKIALAAIHVVERWPPSAWTSRTIPTVMNVEEKVHDLLAAQLRTFSVHPVKKKSQAIRRSGFPLQTSFDHLSGFVKSGNRYNLGATKTGEDFAPEWLDHYKEQQGYRKDQELERKEDEERRQTAAEFRRVEAINQEQAQRNEAEKKEQQRKQVEEQLKSQEQVYMLRRCSSPVLVATFSFRNKEKTSTTATKRKATRIYNYCTFRSCCPSSNPKGCFSNPKGCFSDSIDHAFIDCETCLPYNDKYSEIAFEHSAFVDGVSKAFFSSSNCKTIFRLSSKASIPSPSCAGTYRWIH